MKERKNMKEFIYWTNCDFCGQEKMTIGTTHGIYCKDCLRLMIEEYEEKIEHLEGVENEA